MHSHDLPMTFLAAGHMQLAADCTTCQISSALPGYLSSSGGGRLPAQWAALITAMRKPWQRPRLRPGDGGYLRGGGGLRGGGLRGGGERRGGGGLRAGGGGRRGGGGEVVAAVVVAAVVVGSVVGAGVGGALIGTTGGNGGEGGTRCRYFRQTIFTGVKRHGISHGHIYDTPL